jgi:hypothetical protein
MHNLFVFGNAVKPAHDVTSIKQSYVLKCQVCIVLKTFNEDFDILSPDKNRTFKFSLISNELKV